MVELSEPGPAEIKDGEAVMASFQLRFRLDSGYPSMTSMHPDVDAYLSQARRWGEEMRALRAILLDCQLTEEFKWRAPCYTFQQSNIAILGGLKDCCTLSFFKGVLLKDPERILSKPGENSRAVRLIRIPGLRKVFELESILKSYIQEAMEVERAGLKVDFGKDRELEIPVEFQEKLDENPALKMAFAALTPGRQRAYLLHFSAPKQSRTRASRVEKRTPQILEGKGLNDCTCGLTRRPPACDGSHKSRS